MLRVDAYSWNDGPEGPKSIRRLDMWFLWKPEWKAVKVYVAKHHKPEIRQRLKDKVERHGIEGLPSRNRRGDGFKRYYVSDGLEFLKQLPVEYRASYVYATAPYKIESEEHGEHEWKWSYRNWKKCFDEDGSVPMQLWKVCKVCSAESLVYTRTSQRLFKLGTDQEEESYLLQEYLNLETVAT